MSMTGEQHLPVPTQPILLLALEALRRVDTALVQDTVHRIPHARAVCEYLERVTTIVPVVAQLEGTRDTKRGTPSAAVKSQPWLSQLLRRPTHTHTHLLPVHGSSR